MDEHGIDWPANDQYALPREIVSLLPVLLALKKPKRILEVGIGLSTLILDRWAQANGAEHIVIDAAGPEHDAACLRVAERGMNMANVHALPLLEDGWFDLTDVCVGGPIDLLLVDGPNDVRDSARARAFYSENVGLECVVVYDDTNKPVYEAIMRHIVESRGGHLGTLSDPQYRHRRTMVAVVRGS